MKDSNYQKIARYLEGTANEQERQELKKWRSTNSTNEKQFQEARLLWEKGHLTKVHESEIKVDTNAALRKVKKQIGQPTQVVNMRRRWLSRIAAAAIILLVAGLWFFNKQVEIIEVSTLANQQKEITLPDNSKVWLNENSTLRYPAQFARQHRTVDMSGDAIFEVTPNKTKPFRVETEELEVKVLGTKFNVQSAESKTPLVHVLHGKVQVQKAYDDKRIIILENGMTASLEQGKLQVAKSFSPNELFWHNKTLTFEALELEKVFKDLEVAYNVEVGASNQALNSCPFTGSFENKTLPDILETLQIIYQFEIKAITTNQYQITKGKCN